MMDGEGNSADCARDPHLFLFYFYSASYSICTREFVREVALETRSNLRTETITRYFEYCSILLSSFSSSLFYWPSFKVT